MEILNINFENKTVREYDNMGAHNAAKLMMNKYENLTIQFKTGKDNFPYAWLESRSMAGFKLILNQKELIWLMGYLKEGKTEDFGTEPKNVEAYKEDKDNDLQLAMFKQLVEAVKFCNSFLCSVRLTDISPLMPLIKKERSYFD